MSHHLDRLNLVDDKTKLLAFGYIHELDYIQQNWIPDDIINICTLYLYCPDQFLTCGHAISISSGDSIFGGNNRAVVTGADRWNSVYGEYNVDCDKQHNNIYEWTFEIEAEGVSIGIDSSFCACLDYYCFGLQNDSNLYYALGNDGILEYEHSQGSWHETNLNDRHEFCKPISHGDTVKMIFNIAQRTLSFHRNNEDLGIAYDSVETTHHVYKMAIAIDCQHGDDLQQYVELTKFVITSS
eukprot:480500_1